MPAEPTYGTGAKLTEVARQRLATERKAWRKGRARTPSTDTPGVLAGHVATAQGIRQRHKIWNTCAARASVNTLRCPADHPFGFVAKPASLPNGAHVGLLRDGLVRTSPKTSKTTYRAHPTGETDWAVWRCSVPGKKGTDWEGGALRLLNHILDAAPSTARKPMSIAETSLPLLHFRRLTLWHICRRANSGSPCRHVSGDADLHGQLPLKATSMPPAGALLPSEVRRHCSNDSRWLALTRPARVTVI